MHKVQKTWTQEIKREAVRLAQTSGKPITQVARELGISDTRVHQWCKQLAEHGPEAFPGSGHQTALEEETRRLKRELDLRTGGCSWQWCWISLRVGSWDGRWLQRKA